MGTPDAALATTLGPAATLAALEARAVVRWWQTTSFLEVAGPDAASFLDGLCTQAVERVERGTAVAGLFLDAKAKIIAPAILHRVEDAPWRHPRTPDAAPVPAPRLLLETLPELVEPLAAHLGRYRLRAKASLQPVQRSTVALVGAGADDVPRSGWTPAGTGPDVGSWTRQVGQGWPTWSFLGSPEACAEVVRAASEDGIGLADATAFEAARIDRGDAGLHDLLPGRMPAEVGGMEAAVALDAGCYLGQEPVARLHYRGRANRTLRRLDSPAPLDPGDAPPGLEADEQLELRREGDPAEARPVGRLTTWSTLPDGRTVALAVLRREVAAGESLTLPAGGTAMRPVDAPPE